MRRTASLLTPLFCALAAILVPLHAAGRDDVRAVWVRHASIESAEAVRRTIASASTAGFNTLFVQVAGDTGAAAQFDPIAETISQAHATGLRVHAWIDVARVTVPGELPFARTHVVYQHPEWLMVPRTIAAELLSIDAKSPDYLGRIARWTRTNTDRADALYISPLQPGAAAYLANEVRELVRHYPFDGVYFDHVQYPADDFDYGAMSMAAFRDAMRRDLPLAERQRIDAIEAIDPFAYPNELADQWRLFRRSQLTALIARLHSTVKEVRPDAVVSAAVTPDAGVAERDHLQDWRTWAENHFIDALCPVFASGTPTQIADQVAQVSALAAGLPVWVAAGPSPTALTRAAVKTP